MIHILRNLITGYLVILTLGSFQPVQPRIVEEFANLHTDKVLYQVGDIIYFSLFISSKPYIKSEVSVIGYVELHSSNNDVLCRLKLKCDSGRSFGNIELPNTLPTGIYYLKPFTLWMKNFDPRNSTLSPLLIYNTNDPTDINPLIDQLNNSFINFSDETNTSVLSIRTSKNKYGTRERVEITIDGESKKSSIQGSYSVSVRLFEDSTISKKGYNPKIQLERELTLKYPKERLVYPKITESLEPFQNFELFSTGESRVLTDVRSAMTRSVFVNELNAVYGTTSAFEYSYLKLPSDVTYIPDEYQTLETMKDFIKEIIPQARVLRKKGEDQIRIRNSENSQRVYLFKGSPLIMIDGYIVDDIQAVLRLEPAKVRAIDITYKLETINLSAVSQLTDNGVLSIYTKDKIGERIGLKKIYEEFHEPILLKEFSHKAKTNFEDIIPDFRNSLYWNPLMNINESFKFIFYTSDEPGKFLVEVTGITQTGNQITTRKIIEVSLQN